MKKKTQKLIGIAVCIILIYIYLSNAIIFNDAHIFECKYSNCDKCLVIYILQELFQKLYILIAYIIIYIIAIIININISIFPNLTLDSLVLLKVKLNE